MGTGAMRLGRGVGLQLVRLGAIFLGCSACAMTASAETPAAAPAETSQAPAPSAEPDARPDWSGTWATDIASMLEGMKDCCEGSGTHVPLTPAYRKIRDEDASGEPVADASKSGARGLSDCLPAGVPGILMHPILFEFLMTPGRVTMIFEDAEVRRIWTDGRDHPAEEDLVYSYSGDSIGHWEGDTLVVDTIGIAPTSDMFMAGRIKATKNTRVVERIRLAESGQIEIQMTITDPLIFEKPFKVTKKYQKVPGTFPVGCAANNRDLDTSIDLEPPF